MPHRRSTGAERELVGRSVLKRALVVTLPMVFLALTGCRFHYLSAESLEQVPQAVTSPVKAHLVDGSVVMFPEGVVIDRRAVAARGTGIQYDLRLENPQIVTTLPLDSVAAMESFSTPMQVAASGVGTLGSGLLFTVAGAWLLLVFTLG